MRKIIDAVRTYLRESDMFLLAICIVSSIYGLVLVSSATRTHIGGSYLFVQTGAIILGIVVYIIISLIDLDIIADKYKLLFVVGALFIATLFKWGYADDTGNKAWLRFFGVGIQPAEVVKIFFIFIVARMVSAHRDSRSLNSASSIFKIAFVFATYFVLILTSSSDLGSALVYVFIFTVMLFVGGVGAKWFALAGALVAAGLPMAWQFLMTEKQQLRILAVYYEIVRPNEENPIDPTGLHQLWQTNQSKLAISSGGFLGQGLYNGKMTQSEFIPQQHTDFIFSAAGEELGFVGCVAIIILLTALVARCLYVGVRSNDTLGLLVCSGVAATVIFQTLENIGMCLGLTPVIGLTLPFFSYGGSSILTTFIMMGLVSGVKMRPKPSRFRSM